METKIAAALWGLSALFQLISILIAIVAALIVRNSILFRLMLRSLALTSLTGGLCLFAFLSPAEIISSLGIPVILAVSAATILIIHGALPRNLVRPVGIGLVVQATGLAVIILELTGGFFSIAGQAWPGFVLIGRWWVVGVTILLFTGVILRRRSWIFSSSPLVRPRRLVRIGELAVLLAFASIVIGVFWPGDAPLRFFSFTVASFALVAIVPLGARPGSLPTFMSLTRRVVRLNTAMLPLVLLDVFLPRPLHPAPDALVSVMVCSGLMFTILFRSAVKSAFAVRPSDRTESNAPIGLRPELSPRQRDVARMLSEGLTYSQIGENLFISPETVKSHTKVIYEKFQVAGRAELRKRWIELGD